MAYTQRLLDSAYFSHLPDQLIEHLHGEELIDSRVDYQDPIIEDIRETPIQKDAFTCKPTDVRIPARLASPLIPYPPELCSYIEGSKDVNSNDFHGHHTSQLSALEQVYRSLADRERLPHGSKHFGMDSLKRFARQSYSDREKLINLATLSFAKRATAHDISVTAGQQVPFSVSNSSVSSYTSFIIMIQRLRIHIAKESQYPKLSDDFEFPEQDEATYTMLDNGVYIYRRASPGNSFVLMSCGGHFRIYHEQLGYWFCGPTSYLDYLFTLSDILNNLDVLSNCSEYSWAARIFSIMIDFAECEGHHNRQVDFMKGMEGFILNMSDYDEEYAMNWKPILEASHELWGLDQEISGVTYDFGLVFALLRGKKFKYPNQSFFCKMITAGKELSRTHLQEISALHKFIFYSEVSARAGVLKFLQRVHTPRAVDPNAIRNITRLAKQLFFISYWRKHKAMPNLITSMAKRKILEVYCQKKEVSLIEGLNLSWWDDVKIWDCMDNTLTDDPLEFAKDKGALKNDISFGPGDSRKELLQVIEREDYELKDFFKSKKIAPKRKMVVRTRQKSKPTRVEDPARLIEKEREQKRAARLFANGELSNKHSLSLVTARMKKALTYFDEQLMTPSDKQRKALIHEASRELAQPDNYSLLLDIEGHNQSMQHENTAELAEFVGNLFGHDGWGDIGHYFGQLTVFHYDEYKDDVIHSEGQLGGIEGWLNPLWTMHTLIMMKLLRIMTDLVVQTILVYSDDVNAVVKIPQASEPMVKSVFSKIMSHCTKFGMTIKYSQTTLSRHRITMLRQHYADGIRADSTLKRLLSVSAGNNPTIVSEEIEVAGICSSASSAMELSNHHEACSYLKNYKLGLLLCRLPQMILSKPVSDSMISSESLPPKLSNLIYYSKDDKSELNILSDPDLFVAVKNDIASYLGRNPKSMGDGLLKHALSDIYGVSVARTRLADSPDRVLYLQIYDNFLQDLLFFWTYLPCSLGGLGASLHINLMLSGHSIGLSKSLHYLFQWIVGYSSDSQYFLRYLSTTLSVDMSSDINTKEARVVTETWPSEKKICPALTSVQQSIKSMVRRYAKNKKVIEMFDMSDERESLAENLLEIFRKNFHSRIVQFYHENTSIHFLDLLISKIETSSGLLTRVKNISRLRNSLSFRTIENIRICSMTSRDFFFDLGPNSDVIDCLLDRKCKMFPKINFIQVEEVLYDDKLEETEVGQAILTIRRCSPMHYRNGIKVFDDPKVGNETLYKGELMDDDRLLGHKEELLAAKLVAVTKWFLMKHNLLSRTWEFTSKLDVIVACNMSLSTLTTERFQDLFHYAPTETGGEILHRIPNIRFSTATYIRAEMNRSLNYTTDMNQQLLTAMDLVDSNVNFDYLRMRLLVSAIVLDKYDSLRRMVVRYAFKRLTGIRDVQFVAPKESPWIVKKVYHCYSLMRGHMLSQYRFRYLSRSYLYTENVSEWALIPSQKEIITADAVGKAYVEDIIYRYARDLDKDYMSVSPRIVNADVWKPLIDKLYSIDPDWKISKHQPDINEVRDRLLSVLATRRRITQVDRTNKVHLELQTACLDCISDCAPSDMEYHMLTAKYGGIIRNRRHSATLAVRLAQYQSMLDEVDYHKLSLAKSLIMEYVITFHCKIKTRGRDVFVDVPDCMREFAEEGAHTLSLFPIAPDLQVRLLILGIDYVRAVVRERYEEISNELSEICTDISFADILAPQKLPSVGTFSILTGAETIPEFLMEIEYESMPIGYSAMESLDQLEPLAKYAQLCSTTGASPYTFFSHTGSDSMGAQLGLFRNLVANNIIDDETRICDLTGGRGDGLYASNSLGLDSTCYSREDTFTRVFYHPDVKFKNDYDLFDGRTLKFLTAYDHIHIDVSFTGDRNSNVLDVILFLEEHNLSYSIRMNSCVCSGYTAPRVEGLPKYDHYISYASNSNLKPYQIYLVGVPSVGGQTWDGRMLKESIAFKSLALAFSRLLAPGNFQSVLNEYQPNSSSIYLPKDSALTDFVTAICLDTIEEEQRYYLTRYVSEMGQDCRIDVVPMFLPGDLQEMMDQRSSLCNLEHRSVFGGLSSEHIGKVSDQSRPFHEKHLQALQDANILNMSIPFSKCDVELLEHFRSRHPVGEIRSWCNIYLGLLQFCGEVVSSGHDHMLSYHKTLMDKTGPKLSLHQRELQTAIKLMVLAARDDDYTYGVRYCHKLLASKRRPAKTLERTLKIYRLISFLLPVIKHQMQRGKITIRAIEAVSSALEVRELKKYKYKRQNDNPIKPTEADEDLSAMIDRSLVDLFASLEAYSTTLIESPGKPENGQDMAGIMTAATMAFDLDIGSYVDRAVERLGLVPTGPFGTIDLGDEDIYENDDW